MIKESDTLFFKLKIFFQSKRTVAMVYRVIGAEIYG